MKTVKAYLFLVMAGALICSTWLSPAWATNQLEFLQDDIEETMERLDEVEKKTLQDKMSIGAEIRVRSNFFTFKHKSQYDPETSSYVPLDIDEYTPNLLNTRFRLNLKANVTKTLNFHGRLSMFTYWSDQVPPTVGGVPFARGQGSDEYLLVERAYADYFFTPPFPVVEKIPMAFTIGRLPLADGLPTNLRENTPRKSTYPSMAYDLIADGVALSLDLEQYIPLPNPALRFIYINLASKGDFTYREPQIPGGNNLLFVQLETGLKGRLEGTTVILNCSYSPSTPPPDNNLVAFMFMGVSAEPVVAEDPTFDNPSSLGTLATATLYAQSDRFLNSWVDWFASAKIQSINTVNRPAKFLVTADFAGTGTHITLPFYFGLLSESNHKNPIAYSFQIGGRVNLPIDSLNEPKLGIEFNWGSKNSIPGTYAAEDPLHKLDVAGAAFDFYYIQPVSRHFSFRLGHTRVYHEYDTSTFYFWTRRNTDQDITNTYLLFDMKF